MTDVCIAHPVAGQGNEQPHHLSRARLCRARAGESARSPRTHAIPTFALHAHDLTTADRIARAHTGRGTEAGGGDPSPEHPERRRSGGGAVRRDRRRFVALPDEASQRLHFCTFVERCLHCIVLVSGRVHAPPGYRQDRQRRTCRAVCVGCVGSTAGARENGEMCLWSCCRVCVGQAHFGLACIVSVM